MDAPIVRGLNDKLYDRRKAAALELEKVVSISDPPKITQIVNQLCLMFTSPSSPLHARNGGLIGLAATAIALGQDFSRWLPVVIPRVLGCFGDAESRVRYYACESLYNIAKVCKGEVLVHFNGIFDALSRLSADSEASVKNGAELLDRLLKDIVSETALNYVSRYPENVDKTFNMYDSEHWHDGHRHGYGNAGGGGYGVGQAGRVGAVGLGGFEKARTHPLEDSPVMAGEGREKAESSLAVGLGGVGALGNGNPGLGLGMENTRSGSRQASMSHPTGPGIGALSSGSIDEGNRKGSLPASTSKGSSGGGELSIHKPDPAGTRDPSPHSMTAPTNLATSPNPTTASLKTSHHRVVSSNSLASPNPGLANPLPTHISDPPPRLAFSLAKFVPLLSERIYVISPFTRSHLVSWITILDSVPDLELVSYLPDFLDGLLKYLSDPSPDVKIATENVLSDFLREIKHIARVQQRQYQDSVPVTGRTHATGGASAYRRSSDMHGHGLRRRGSKMTMDTEASEMESSVHTGNGTNAEDNEGMPSPDQNRLDELKEEDDEDVDGERRWEAPRDSALEDYDEDNEAAEHSAWVPGQGIYVDHQAIMDIMIHHLGYPDEQIQSIALRWTASFLTFAQDVMVGFTPRLIPAILPNLAHHVPYIQSAAIETNQSLFRVIQAIQAPYTPQGGTTPAPAAAVTAPPTAGGALLTSAPMAINLSQSTLTPASSTNNALSISPGAKRDSSDALSATDLPSRRRSQDMADNLKPSASSMSLPRTGPAKSRTMTASPIPSNQPQTPSGPDFPNRTSRPTSPSGIPVSTSNGTMDEEPFDIRETVNILTLQFLSEHVETRVAALEWLSMLHAKAPRKILARDDGTFPALLKTLSDPSEEVVRHDLQLLAQISASSDDSYFTSFLVNLLELFSTDRRLLETRGSLIIRQLCLNLNVERIFRTLGEVLEQEDDLEFASLMVVKLNMILITSPELSEFRKRLRNIESKDGQMLFTSIYKSWCHNAVAVFALCLLAQAYEHASNLLQIFAELEITVALLVQIDKLVMLIESPVFTSLRLQLLEPEKYPYLFKCLYGLLMLLPQSSAFVSLRNRLSAVSSMGFLHIAPRTAFNASDKVANARSKITGRDEIKWQELLVHFRAVQKKHEKARRQAQTGEGGHGHSMSGFNFAGPSAANSPQQTAGLSGTSGDRMSLKDRRKVGALGSGSRKDSGQSLSSGKGQSSVLSPLNPKRLGSGSAPGAAAASATGSFSAMSISAPFMATMGINGSSTGTSTNTGRAKSPPPGANGRSRTILPGLRR